MREQDHIPELIERQIIQQTIRKRELRKPSIRIFLCYHQRIRRVKHRVSNIHILNRERTRTHRRIILREPSKRNGVRLDLREHHVLNQRRIVTRMRNNLLHVNQVHSRIPSIDIRNILKVRSRNRKLHCLLNINIIVF